MHYILIAQAIFVPEIASTLKIITWSTNKMALTNYTQIERIRVACKVFMNPVILFWSVIKTSF